MKILVVSDIHGSAWYAQKALEAVEIHKPDQILILGDILYHGPRNPLPKDYCPAKVVELLNPLQDKILAVRGNCDAEVDQMLLKFNIMSDYTVLYLGNRRIFATHGHLYSPEALPHMSEGDAFLYGHVHLPKAYKENGIYILNPGSITLPKQNNPHTYGLLDEKSFTILTDDHEVFTSVQFD